MEDTTNGETSQLPLDQSADARTNQEEELKRAGFVFLSNSEAKNPYNIFRVTAEVLQEQGFGVRVLPDASVRRKGRLENYVAIYVRESDIPVNSEGKKLLYLHPIHTISGSPLMHALLAAGRGIRDGIDTATNKPYSLTTTESYLNTLSQDGVSVGIEKRIRSLAYSQLINGIQEESQNGWPTVSYQDQGSFQKVLPELQATQIAEGLDQPLADIEVRDLVKHECNKFVGAYPEFKPMNV